MKKCVRDLFAGIVFVLLSVVYYVASHGIQSFGNNSDFISAKTIPTVWAILMLVLAFVLIVRSLFEMKRLKVSGEELWTGRSVKSWFTDHYTVLGTFILLFAYALVLRPVGYLLTTFIYLIIQIILLTEQKKINKKLVVKALILSVVFSILSDYLFVKLLSVPLPSGILGF